MQQRRGTAIFESRKGLLSFFSWCCGFFMIGYVVFLSRSFSFFIHLHTVIKFLFGRICNPTVTNTSIFNARKQQEANKHNSKMWGVVYVADYKSLYSQLLDCKSSRTRFTAAGLQIQPNC